MLAYQWNGVTIRQGDCIELLRTLDSDSVDCCVTSPPYWGQRDYGAAGQIGCESHPDEYVARLVAVFSEVRRVLKSDGTCWLNLGDTYNSPINASQRPQIGLDRYERRRSGRADTTERGDLPARGEIRDGKLKPKDLIGIPWRVALALQADGWWLRQDTIWHKPNAQPEGASDRCSRDHEYVFLLTKGEDYRFDKKALKHRRTVWRISTQRFSGAHFATFPESLVRACLSASMGERRGIVLDPFFGSGTTGVVAREFECRCIGLELNPQYVAIAMNRLRQGSLLVGV